MTVKSIYFNLCSKYCRDLSTITDCWNALGDLYAEPHRFYHNFTHLEDLLNQAESVKTEINDIDTFGFSIFYHDAIYNVYKSDNEEKSAELARQHLLLLNVNTDVIEKCVVQIIATKNHQISLDNDTNLFMDIDMSILGTDSKNYRNYAANVRKEYKIYPRILYNRGRKKVLQNMLDAISIYHTRQYQESHENQARINIKQEIQTL